MQNKVHNQAAWRAAGQTARRCASLMRLQDEENTAAGDEGEGQSQRKPSGINSEVSSSACVPFSLPAGVTLESGAAYRLSREEPEEEVAVVLLVDGQVAGVALDVGSGQLPHQAQSAGWGTTACGLKVSSTLRHDNDKQPTVTLPLLCPDRFPI